GRNVLWRKEQAEEWGLAALSGTQKERRTMQELGAVRNALNAGELDGPLKGLLCHDLTAGRKRVADLLDGFQKTFGAGENTPVTLCSAPGRTEICGNHTDHQHGRVLAGAVDLDFLACAAPNGTN